MDVLAHLAGMLRRVTSVLPALVAIYVLNTIVFVLLVQDGDSIDKEFRNDFFTYYKWLTIACVGLLFLIVFNRVVSSRQLPQHMPYIKSAEEYEKMAKAMKESDEIT